MNCGDVVHRSTLDLAARGELRGLDWRGVALLATVGAYLFLAPGVLPCAIDFYVLSPLFRQKARVITREDITLGRKIASGGFGTVYRGELQEPGGGATQVVVKTALDFGEAEVWMNERMERVGSGACASFLGAFEAPTPGEGKDAIWLVWKFEGNNSVSNLMEKKEFPYNLEQLLLGRELRLPRGPARKLVSVKLLMRQLFEALVSMHNTGIVHRDIKPQNMIVSESEGRLKLIDLGGAADLRIGLNYVPNEYLMDPRYAPPQLFVMSTQTPKPPPVPVAAFLSPVLWRMENPDRFDMYACGLVLMQAVFPMLRQDRDLIAFNKKLESLNWDLGAWRSQLLATGPSKETLEGFEMLDADDGAGWDMVRSLMAYKPSSRLSAAECLAHPFIANAQFDTSPLTGANSVLSGVRQKVKEVGAAVGSSLDSLDLDALGSRDGALTEAFLQKELGLQDEVPKPRAASQTVALFQARQKDLMAKRRSSSASASFSSVESDDGTQVVVPAFVKKGAKPSRPQAAPAALPPAAAASPPAARASAPRSGNASNGNGNGNGGGAAGLTGLFGKLLPKPRAAGARPAAANAAKGPARLEDIPTDSDGEAWEVEGEGDGPTQPAAAPAKEAPAAKPAKEVREPVRAGAGAGLLGGFFKLK